MKYQWRECAAPSLTHIKPRQIAAGYDHLFERYCPKADNPRDTCRFIASSARRHTGEATHF